MGPSISFFKVISTTFQLWGFNSKCKNDCKKWTKPNELKLQGPHTLCLPTKQVERITSLDTPVRKEEKFKAACFVCWIRMPSKVPAMYQEGLMQHNGSALSYWNTAFCPPCLGSFRHFNDILYIKSFLITTLEIKEADGVASLLPNRRHLLYRTYQ